MAKKDKNGVSAPDDRLASLEEVDAYIPTPPDGGWGWVVVAASLMCNIIVDGIGYTFGIFLLEFSRYFNAPKSKVALIGSLQVGMYLCAGPVVSGMTNKFGCRPVCIAGSIIATIAFVISTFSPNVEMLMATYGVLGGFGFGMMYLPAIVSVGFYFEKKRAIATGIGVCGSGVGMFIFAPFSRYLLNELDWKNALLILAGIVFNGAVCGMLMRPLEAKPPKKKKAPPKPTPIVKNMKSQVKKVQAVDGVAYSSVPNMVVHSTSEKPDTKFKGKPVDAKFLAAAIDSVKDQDETEEVPLVDKIHFLDVEDRIRQSSPHHGHDLTFISEANLNRIKGDLSRPMYRKDIFYSGSVQHIPQFRSQPDMTNYIRSITSIPSFTETETCMECKCLPKPVRDTLTEMLDLSLLKDMTFMLICLGNILAMLGFYVPFVYIVDRAISLGIDESKAAFLLSIIGITNTVGRILAGFLADLRMVDSLLINNIAMLLLGIATMLAPLCTSYGLLCLFAAFFGLCVAAYISLTSIIICDLLGLEKLTNAFGLVTLARGISSTAGPPLAGALYDLNNDYKLSFYVGGALVIAGALCHFLLHTPCLKRKPHAEGAGINIGDLEEMQNRTPDSKDEHVSPARVPNIVIEQADERN